MELRILQLQPLDQGQRQGSRQLHLTSGQIDRQIGLGQQLQRRAIQQGQGRCYAALGLYPGDTRRCALDAGVGNDERRARGIHHTALIGNHHPLLRGHRETTVEQAGLPLRLLYRRQGFGKANRGLREFEIRIDIRFDPRFQAQGKVQIGHLALEYVLDHPFARLGGQPLGPVFQHLFGGHAIDLRVDPGGPALGQPRHIAAGTQAVFPVLDRHLAQPHPERGQLHLEIHIRAFQVQWLGEQIGGVEVNAAKTELPGHAVQPPGLHAL